MKAAQRKARGEWEKTSGGISGDASSGMAWQYNLKWKEVGNGGNGGGLGVERVMVWGVQNTINQQSCLGPLHNWYYHTSTKVLCPQWMLYRASETVSVICYFQCGNSKKKKRLNMMLESIFYFPPLTGVFRVQ